MENYPHNLIFNAFIFGGWFGGMALLYVIYFQLKECIHTFKNRNANPINIILASTVCAMIANGITHNQSIVNAEIVTWMVWGAYYYNKKLDVQYV